MKKILSVISSAFICCMYCANAASQLDTTSYCPLTVGMKLTYSNYSPDGKKTSTYTMEIKETEGDFHNGTIVYDMIFLNEDNEPVLKNNRLSMKVVKTSEGTTSYMKDVRLIMKVQNMISKGDVSSIPTVLTKGMSIKNGIIDVKVGNIGSSILTNDRKVTGTQEITTPAGEFKTFIIEETQTTKSIFNVTEKIKSWYVKGIGCVKQEVRDKHGKLTNRQVLEKVEYL